MVDWSVEQWVDRKDGFEAETSVVLMVVGRDALMAGSWVDQLVGMTVVLMVDWLDERMVDVKVDQLVDLTDERSAEV